MDAGLVVLVVLALAFAFTNGVQDAANSIATLVATRAGRPAPALAVATVGVFLGPLLIGSAVADTIGGIVDVDRAETVEVVIAALVGALAWNLAAWYRGLPSSSTHALVGGLTGAAIAAAGLDAVNWGSVEGWRPGGVLGVFVALAVSPVLGAGACFLVLVALRRALRRGTKRFTRPVRDAQWVTSALLSVGQGANDAQKAVGVIVVALVAEDVTDAGATPFWALLAGALAMALGTALGGWRLVRTIGKRIYELRPLDALSNQTTSAAVILGASALGAPVSSTHVVASSVVGAGLGRRRWGRIRWAVVSEMALAWLTTFPATALLAGLVLGLWRLVT